MRNAIRPKDKPQDTCFILYGSRYSQNMKSFGLKQLYKNYYNKYLICLQLDAIMDVYPKAEIILVVGPEFDRLLKLNDHRVRYVENQLCNETNEIDDIRLALNNTHAQNVFLINSDIYFNKYAISDITESTIIYDTRAQLEEDIGLVVANNTVTHLDFKLDKTWCNITALYGETLKTFKTVCTRTNSKLYLFEVLNSMLDRGVKFTAKEPLHMVLTKIDTPQAFRKYSVGTSYK